MTEPTALHRVKCQEPGCAYQMLAISDLRYVMILFDIDIGITYRLSFLR